MLVEVGERHHVAIDGDSEPSSSGSNHSSAEIRARTAAQEWLLPGNDDVLSPPDGYVVSFAHFHERGLMTLAHKFLRGLLYYY